MPAFVLLAGGILAFAVTYQLLALQYQPAALAALFWSLPVSQRISWTIIGLTPIALMLFALIQHSKLIARRKAADVLETRLRGIRLDVLKVEQDQNGLDRANEYLGRSDPEGALHALQARVASTEQAIEFHQQRNQSGDLIGSVEDVRQQQQQVKQKLGDVIAKRRSIETSISQLQSSQEEMEQSISVIEQNSDGETLERRLQKLSQFIGSTNTRCGEIERSMPSLLELEDKFEALQRRLSPLEQKETGVNGVLKALTETRTRLAAAIAGLERDEGVPLTDRIQQLTKTRQGLEERVSSVLAQLSEIETIHRDITGLFIRLTQAQRQTRELDAGGRVVSLNG
jgi:chromosome segregation ATPase